MSISGTSSNITQSSNSISLYQGESKDLDLLISKEVKDINGVPVEQPFDLTGCTIYFSVRTKANSPNLLISKTSMSVTEIETLAPLTSGMAVVHLDSDDTKHMDPAEYVFDIWITLSSGKNVPVVEVSSFIVKAAVTKLP